jgi:hypothetical protein
VNINDVKQIMDYDSHDDRLELIFVRQRQLMEQYDQIEVKNGLRVTSDVPVNLHSARGQYVIKDFAWRVTEELGEALEAFHLHADHPEHFDEEISDALHFLVELTILAGFSETSIAKRWIDIYDSLEFLYIEADKPNKLSRTRSYFGLCMRVGKFTEALAMTCNTLKNKPWKQTQMMTDTAYFQVNLELAWLRFIQICITANIDSNYLFVLYFKKSEVNKFRQRSNY